MNKSGRTKKLGMKALLLLYFKAEELHSNTLIKSKYQKRPGINPSTSTKLQLPCTPTLLGELSMFNKKHKITWHCTSTRLQLTISQAATTSCFPTSGKVYIIHKDQIHFQEGNCLHTDHKHKSHLCAFINSYVIHFP